MERNISSSSAYRKLRTNVEYNEKHPHMHSICLTSVNHGAGTTTGVSWPRFLRPIDQRYY